MKSQRNRIKVLYIIGGMDRGGAESFVLNTARTIDRQKFDIVILCYTNYTHGNKYVYQDDLKKLGISIIKIADNRFRNPLKFVSDIKKFIKKTQPNIVHSHSDMISGLTLLAAKSAGVTMRIAHSHSAFSPKLKSLPNKLFGWLLRRILDTVATHRIACSIKAGEFLFGKKQFHVLQNSIDVEKFRFNDKYRKELRKSYSISAADEVLLNIGRLAPVKNQEFLIKMFAEYRANNHESKLFIIGDGDERKNLLNQIAQLDLTEYVFVLSARNDIYKYYSFADLFVMPSFFEGFPFVAIEAQANGIPCLFSDTISSESAITNDVKFLSLKSSTSSWSKKAAQVLRAGRHNNFSNLLGSNYNIKNSVMRLEKLYEEVYVNHG